ncbi:MAG TPA: hypothetical protein VFO39_02160 [Candidatus Sulfotelmatobacter sp.]|nr:hypothetical protein [Candidatus Sulfotelmatobacter sp.]
MRRVMLLVLTGLAVVLAWAYKPQSTAVKTCRVDARAFATEDASYDAEYDSLYGTTTLAQRSMSDLLDRDKELIGCLSVDRANRDNYRALLYRNEAIESDRLMQFVLNSKQADEFAQWERGQQSAQLAKYQRTEQHEDRKAGQP